MSNCAHCGEPIHLADGEWRHVETGEAHCRLTVAEPLPEWVVGVLSRLGASDA